MMFAEKHHLASLSAAELDEYLARGWYRMGQTIFTTHFLCFGSQFYSAIWVRLPLEGYQFSKSLRKIMRRNRARFQYAAGPAHIDAEREALYSKYRNAFPGLLSPSLYDSLLDGGEHNIFQTFEITVHDGEQLVAISYFDLGRQSAASIIGIYDPAYRNYSLGLYTMLEEIDFCQRIGKAYFYPGYVAPGYPRFDYKLRIGQVEYFEVNKQDWLPYVNHPHHPTPLSEMEHQLQRLQQLLHTHRLPGRLMRYPLFEANLFGFWSAPYLEYPVFLLCATPPRYGGYMIVVYDVRVAQYKLLRCTPFDNFGFHLNEAFFQHFNPEEDFTELLVEEEVLLSSANAEFIVLALHKLRTLK